MIRTVQSILRPATMLTLFVSALALASLLGPHTANAGDGDIRRPGQLQARLDRGSAASHYAGIDRLFAAFPRLIPLGHRYRRQDHHGHHDRSRHNYGGHGYRDYDRDSDSHHSSRHNYRPQGYYCSRCHYRTPSRHIFFNHLHHHHHIPWYKAVSYLVWSPIHLVFVFD